MIRISISSLQVGYPAPACVSQFKITVTGQGWCVCYRQWSRVASGCIRLHLFLCLGLWSSEAFAQLVTPANLHLTTTNGLPHNTITGVEQDRAGFVWIATADGLARYDGRAVKVFRHRPGDPTSLIDNKISQFDQTSSGTFLVTTESGSFQLVDPITETFTTLLDERFLKRNKIPVMYGQLSADGRHFWGLLPSIRLIDYDLHRKTFKVYDVPTLVGKTNELHDFILTPTGYIYSECSFGLFQYDTKTGRKRIIPFPFKVISGLQGEGFWSINRHKVALGPNGQIAVFGYDVIALFDPVRNQFRIAPIPNVARTDNSPARRLANVVTYGLKTLSNKQLYVGYMNRLYRFDASDRRSGGQRSGNQLTLLRQSATPTNKLVPWLIDRSDVLWISDGPAGLTRLDVHPSPFSFLPKRKSFNEDLLEQNLGVALPDSFEVWDNDYWPRFTTYLAGSPIGSPERRSVGYLIDPSRVYRYSVANRTLTEVTAFQSLDNRICCKLCLKTSHWDASRWRPSGRKAAEAGAIWVYNNRRGLIGVSADETKGYVYPHSQLPLTNLNPAYDAGDIQPLGRSVWVGSQYGLGLFRYDIDRQRYDAPLRNNPRSVNSLPVNSINCLSADPNDPTVLWIGTAGGGLCRLATRSMTFRRLSEAEGFPNGTIQGIETDQQGMLWCATNRGLVRVNPQTLTWRHFTTDDGLAENQFLHTSSACLPDGQLVFGTPNGRVVFDPKQIRDSPFEPPVVLTSILINNKPVDAHPSSIDSAGAGEPRAALPAPLNTLSELRLDHTQNFLTLSFAGLDYGNAQKLAYRYKLTGVDRDWITVGTQNTANYTQLAPGHYVFSVSSTRADGSWSHQVKRLSIVITPPFWATWWAYLVYALAFGGLLLGFIRFRIRQARQQQEIILKRREAEQLRAVDEVKTRFFTNITHEFRTPLTLILSPTEKLLQEPKHDPSTRQSLSSIHQNAGQLLRLVNQLLDLSRLEGGSLNLAMVQGNGVALIERLVENFRPMAASRGIALQLQTAELAGVHFGSPWLFDADKWETILSNLLANALKFTPTGGQVSITLELPTADRLVLHLADTGVGIPPQHIPHIFERFYQVDTSQTRAYEGTGIGLALVSELTEVLGGSVTVQSRTEPPTGTTFTLSLPLRPATDWADAPELVLPGTNAPAWWTTPTEPTKTDREPIPSVANDAPLVLVVEDNEELRTFLANELASRYRVQTAADGEEGWAICQRELPDVVVSDVMMPRLDGYQLTQRIKSTLATNHLAVVLLTARTAQESRMAGLEQGADEYLTKPFHLEELFLRLENMLTRQANLRAYLYRQLAAPAVEIEEPMGNAFVRALQQAIEARLDDGTFSVDDLARAVAISRRTLHRKLASVTGLTPTDFIRHYRLQRAAHLLKAGRSITQTAYSVGFESPSYFTSVFRQTYQQTPSEFVHQHGL